ncbi:MAG: UvrD-helicase domain-containing protein [Actinomycetota bacterium]|nr:UvrD-helicase domain-containing protein [Actinomycetota bacterium]
MEWNGKGWKLTTSADELVLDIFERTKIFTQTKLSTIIIRRWLLSSHKFLGFGSARIIDTRTGYEIKLRGLSRLEQRKLESEISTILIEYDLNSSTSWKQNLDNLINSAVNNLQPISESSRNLIKSSKPSDLTEQRLRSHKRTPEIMAALSGLQVDYNELINKTNKQIQIVVDLNSVDSWNGKLNELINNAKRNLELIKDKEREEIKSSKPSNEIFTHLSSLLHSDPSNKEAEKAVEILNTDIDKLIDTTNEFIQMTLDVNYVASWKKELDALTKGAMKNLRWISQEITEKIASEKPSGDLLERLKSYSSTSKTVKAISDLKIDVEQLILNTNQKVLKQEKRERKRFFDTIEQSPLTNEQAEAVISYDNRVQVIASAGSGKTSVMVARTAYAIDKGFVKPNRVLLLAFNKDAAVELEQRINQRLSVAGIPSDGINASTFHALGLGIIAHASGKKPRVAPWVQNNQDIKEILKIVDQLRDADEEFRLEWDMFRLVWGRPVDDQNPDGGVRDGYDKQKGRTGFKTNDGKVVKSHGERLICNWLWFRGVRYSYEKPFFIDTASVQHSQYHPDFYYPDIDSWHEHWGIDENGRASAEMERKDYLESMKWKRKQHQDYSSKPLIETYFYEVVKKLNFSPLEDALESRGIVLDHDPQREPEANMVLDNTDLASLILTFMRHVKSNQFSKTDVETLSKDNRTIKFLKIFWPIFDMWNQNLRNDNYVDFEDMLAKAADALER